jgi:hypothetical protein
MQANQIINSTTFWNMTPCILVEVYQSLKMNGVPLWVVEALCHIAEGRGFDSR